MRGESLPMKLIELRDLHKTYHLGEIDVPVLKGISLTVSPWRVCRPHGHLGIGQDHAHEHSGVPRPAHFRGITGWMARMWWPVGRRAGPAPEPEDRLRLPELQSAAADQRPGKRHDAAVYYRTAPLRPRRGASGPETCCSGSGWGIAWITNRRNFPAASSSGWPLPGPSSMIPPSCSPTSPPETSIPTPVKKSWNYSGDSTRRKALPSSWSPTTPTSPAPPDGSSGLPMGWWKPKNSSSRGSRTDISPVAERRGGDRYAQDWRGCGPAHSAYRPPRSAAQRHAGRSDHARHHHRRGRGHRHDGDRAAARRPPSRQTIASMGANNLLVLPGTASSGGVSFGAGSAMTLTPQDADAF